MALNFIVIASFGTTVIPDVNSENSDQPAFIGCLFIAKYEI